MSQKAAKKAKKLDLLLEKMWNNPHPLGNLSRRERSRLRKQSGNIGQFGTGKM